MPHYKPPFDPFEGLSKKAKKFDPFARHDGLTPNEGEIISDLQARIAYLEEIADVKTTDRIISHLRFSRERLEVMLSLAEKEISALRAERDAPVDELESKFLALALREINSLRAERDAALDDLAMFKDHFRRFAQQSHKKRQELEGAINQVVDDAIDRHHEEARPNG